MGLLDEAIRQHLDLKRQHGATEDEVARQEQEALGPARRAAPAAEPVPGEVPTEDPAGEPESAAVADAPGGEPESTAVAGVGPEPALLEEPPPLEASPDEMEPAAPAPAEPAGEGEGEGESEGEDVLGETPEFLQETPEHDRLWFEQKPPRDFDFDE